MDKITKKLEENSRLKHNIENCKKRIAGKTKDASKDATVKRSRNLKGKEKEREDQTDDDSESEPMGMAVTKASYHTSKENYPLRKSFLLDSAATEHICNDKSRLTNYRVAKPGEHVIAGDRKVPISGYGTMTVHCKPANGKKECRIEARNAHYIPTFHTNLISYDKAMEQGIYWDSKKGVLTKNDKPKCYVFKRHGQWLLEYRPVDDPIDDCTSDSNTGDSNEGEEVKRALETESTRSAANKSMKVIRISDVDFDKLYNPNEPFVEELITEPVDKTATPTPRISPESDNTTDIDSDSCSDSELEETEESDSEDSTPADKGKSTTPEPLSMPESTPTPDPHTHNPTPSTPSVSDLRGPPSAVDSPEEMPGFCSAFATEIYLKDDDQRDSNLRDNLPKEPHLHKDLSATLTRLGLQQMPEKPCLYYNKYIFVISFADDILIQNRPIHRQQPQEMKSVIRDRTLGKLSYIEKIISRYKLQFTKPP